MPSGGQDGQQPAQLALLGLPMAALVVVLWPARLPVYGAMVVQGSISSLMGPANAAINLALVGRKSLGEPLGQNARFASIGAGLAATAIGLVGNVIDGRLVFAGVAAMAIPAWLALGRIDIPANPRPARAPDAPTGWREIVKVLRDPRLTVFAVCACAFHLANGAMMPLSAAALVRDHMRHAELIVGGGIVLPQIVVILCALLGKAMHRGTWAAATVTARVGHAAGAGGAAGGTPLPMAAAWSFPDRRDQRRCLRRDAAPDRGGPD